MNPKLAERFILQNNVLERVKSKLYTENLREEFKYVIMTQLEGVEDIFSLRDEWHFNIEKYIEHFEKRYDNKLCICGHKIKELCHIYFKDISLSFLVGNCCIRKNLVFLYNRYTETKKTLTKDKKIAEKRRVEEEQKRQQVLKELVEANQRREKERMDWVDQQRREKEHREAHQLKQRIEEERRKEQQRIEEQRRKEQEQVAEQRRREQEQVAEQRRKEQEQVAEQRLAEEQRVKKEIKHKESMERKKNDCFRCRKPQIKRGLCGPCKKHICEGCRKTYYLYWECRGQDFSPCEKCQVIKIFKV